MSSAPLYVASSFSARAPALSAWTVAQAPTCSPSTLSVTTWISIAASLERGDKEDVLGAAHRHSVERTFGPDLEHRVEGFGEILRGCLLDSVVILDDADRLEVMERSVDDEDREETIAALVFQPRVFGHGEHDDTSIAYAAPPAPTSCEAAAASKYEGSSIVTSAVEVSA